MSRRDSGRASRKRIAITGLAFFKIAPVAASDEAEFLRTLKVILPKIVARWVRIAGLDRGQFCGSSIAPNKIRSGAGCRDNRFGGAELRVRSTLRTTVRSGVDLYRNQCDYLRKRLEIQFRVELVSDECSGAIRANAISNWGSVDNCHEKNDAENEKGMHDECGQRLDQMNANAGCLGSTEGLLSKEVGGCYLCS